jgi:hypothetical protein
MTYRKRDLQPSDVYYDQWQQFARVRSRSLALFLLLFWGGPVLTTIIAEPLWPHPPGGAVALLIAPWVIAAIVVSQHPIQWRCPRCRKPFHKTFWYYNGFAKRCLNCRLPKWAPGPESA